MSYKTNAVKTTARGYRCIDFHDGGRVEVHFPAYYLRGGWAGGAVVCCVRCTGWLGCGTSMRGWVVMG